MRDFCSSSSSTSSAEQAGSAAQDRRLQDAHAVQPATPAEREPVQPGAGDEAGIAQPARPNLGSRWGPFTVTYRGYAEEGRLAIEVKCPHPWHPTRTFTSRRGRSRTEAGADRNAALLTLIRSLKQRCLLGLPLASKNAHMDLAILPGAVHSMEELEAALDQTEFPE